ncbi:kunitz-type protease inhibitor 2 [Tiliqua scincoides]|uniref:kunitz-type protease inhibitor 2 n=1 Tax=Tiliqua scincoides TaxID=71010 RepID=UPI0034617E0C
MQGSNKGEGLLCPGLLQGGGLSALCRSAWLDILLLPLRVTGWAATCPGLHPPRSPSLRSGSAAAARDSSGVGQQRGCSWRRMRTGGRGPSRAALEGAPWRRRTAARAPSPGRSTCCDAPRCHWLCADGAWLTCGVRRPRRGAAQFSSDGGAMGRAERDAAVARVRGALLLLLALGLGVAGSLPETCLLPKVVGRCRASFPRWWYNVTSQVCQRFTFGGCKGNLNNFLSEQDCLQKCGPGGEEASEVPLPSQGGAVLPVTKVTPKSSHQGELGGGFEEFCAAPQETGPCRAAFPRWHFDVETQTCRMFIYGGCRGNKNNYDLEETCLRRCTGKQGLPADPEEPNMHSHFFPSSTIHSTRAVVLAVLLAVMAAVLVGSMAVFLVRIFRKSQDLSLGSVWNTLDDKEYLMSNAYTL